MRAVRGFSLLELLVFIVVVGLMGVALFGAFSGALLGAGERERSMRATHLAQERLELILAQKQAVGFSAFTAASYDPCTSAPPATHASCSAIPAGYVVSAALAGDWGGDVNYKVITVTVSGLGSAQLQALVADY